MNSLPVAALTDAQIPKRYWTLNLDTFPKSGENAVEAMTNYYHGFTDALEGGIGLTLHGPECSGKTFLACQLMKGLISQDFSVRYWTPNELNSAIVNAPLGRLLQHDHLIVLDAVDTSITDPTPAWQLSLVRQVITIRHSFALPLVIVTRHDSEQFMQMYGGAVTRSLINDALLLPCTQFTDKEQKTLTAKKKAKLLGDNHAH